MSSSFKVNQGFSYDRAGMGLPQHESVGSGTPLPGHMQKFNPGPHMYKPESKISIGVSLGDFSSYPRDMGSIGNFYTEREARRKMAIELSESMARSYSSIRIHQLFISSVGKVEHSTENSNKVNKVNGITITYRQSPNLGGHTCVVTITDVNTDLKACLDKNGEPIGRLIDLIGKQTQHHEKENSAEARKACLDELISIVEQQLTFLNESSLSNSSSQEKKGEETRSIEEIGLWSTKKGLEMMRLGLKALVEKYLGTSMPGGDFSGDLLKYGMGWVYHYHKAVSNKDSNPGKTALANVAVDKGASEALKAGLTAILFKNIGGATTFFLSTLSEIANKVVKTKESEGCPYNPSSTDPMERDLAECWAEGYAFIKLLSLLDAAKKGIQKLVNDALKLSSSGEFEVKDGSDSEQNEREEIRDGIEKELNDLFILKSPSDVTNNDKKIEMTSEISTSGFNSVHQYGDILRGREGLGGIENGSSGSSGLCRTDAVSESGKVGTASLAKQEEKSSLELPSSNIIPPPGGEGPSKPENVDEKKREEQVSFLFGKEDWMKYLGVDIGDEPTLPKDIDKILQGPCPVWKNKKVYETHILVLIPKKVGKNDFNLETLGQLVSAPRSKSKASFKSAYQNCGSRSDLELVLDRYGQVHSPSSHWLLMTRDILPGSLGQSEEGARSIVSRYNNYQMPNVLDVATVMLMEYMKFGNNSCWEKHTRCIERLGGETVKSSRWTVTVGSDDEGIPLQFSHGLPGNANSSANGRGAGIVGVWKL